MLKKIVFIFLMTFCCVLVSCYPNNGKFCALNHSEIKQLSYYRSIQSSSLIKSATIGQSGSHISSSSIFSRSASPSTQTALTNKPLTRSSAKHYEEQGVASWYGKSFHKRRTSSGERYNMYGLTAAHKTLPLSTYVLVTNLVNGRQVVVKVNDRGPFVRNRLIDLSYGAAKKLGMVGLGTAPVDIKAIR